MASPAVRVAAIGGGSFGTCIARLVATAVAKPRPAAAAAAVTVPPPAVSPLELGTPLLDPTVRLWVRREELAEEINTRHTNSQYLSASARLPQNIVASTSLEKVAAGADVVILGVPHQFLPQLLPELSLHTSPSTQIVSLVKSFDYNPDTSELSSLAERISGELHGADVSVLMGPNIYREMNGEAAIEFAEATIGCRPGNARAAYLLPHIFSTPEFSVRVVSDVVGVELCGALKNCVTLSCGFVAGFGLGHNAKAAAIRAGHREMVRFGGEFFGVREALFSEACGMGDLILSCTVGRGQMVATAFIEGGPLGKKKKNEEEEEEEEEEEGGLKPTAAEETLLHEASCERWSALEHSLLHGQKLPDIDNIQEVYAFLSKRGALDRYPFLAATYRVGFEGASATVLLDAMREPLPLPLIHSPSESRRTMIQCK